jgi:hypothetical protein
MEAVMYIVTKKNDSSFLMHHGIQGMHWGIRRFQNNDGSLTSAGRARYGTSGEAKNIKERLTGLDQESANAQYDYKYNEVKRQKYSDKASKARLKGKSEKASKFEERAKQHESERDIAERRLKGIDKNINSIIDSALRDGYDVKMTKIARQADSQASKMIRNQILFGPIGNASYMIAQQRSFKKAGQGGSFSEGFKYDVKPGAGMVTIDDHRKVRL